MICTAEEQAYVARLDRFNDSVPWLDMVDMLLDRQVRRSPGSCFALDVGCGTGSFANRVRARWQHARVYGVDSNLATLHVARARAAEDVEFFYRDAWDGLLVWPRHTFDWVTSIHSLAHMHCPDVTVHEIARVLAPMGTATFVVPNRLYDLLMEPLNRMTGYQGDPTIENHWTAGSLRALLQKHGLHAEITPCGESVPYAPGVRAWLIAEARKVV